jgi:hypothetical protein
MVLYNQHCRGSIRQSRSLQLPRTLINKSSPHNKRRSLYSIYRSTLLQTCGGCLERAGGVRHGRRLAVRGKKARLAASSLYTGKRYHSQRRQRSRKGLKEVRTDTGSGRREDSLDQRPALAPCLLLLGLSSTQTCVSKFVPDLLTHLCA